MYRKVLPALFIVFLLTCGKPTPENPVMTHHDIIVALNPSDHSIKGTDQVKVDGMQKEVGFYLNSGYQNVELQESPEYKLKEVSFDHFKKKFPAMEDDDANDLHRYYIVTSTGGDSVASFTVAFEGIIFDSLKTLKQEYARGFATTTGLIEKRGVYLSGATAWIPTQQETRFTYRLKTKLPVGWYSVSQGSETMRGIRDNFQINEWTCDKPMEEAYLVAGEYLITEEAHNGVQIMTYTYQDEPELTARYRAATKRYIDMYSEQIGHYPFRKFALVENFWPTGYGMPSFTLLGSQIIRLPFIIHTSYGHEILHNWWGNSVYVDWEKGNWCEGLTNYMADHYYKKQRGEDVDYRRSMLQNYLNYVQKEKDFPLTEFKERHNPATQAVGYSKSAMIFHQLYKLLGEDNFFKSVRDFYKNYVFQAASWADVEKAFAAHYDKKDLSWFFDQWINRTGAPFLTIEDVKTEHTGGQYHVSLVLAQTTPEYRLHVPVQFTGNALDTTVVLELKANHNEFHFDFQNPPATVSVDPKYDVFRKLHRSEIPAALSQTYGASQAVVVLPANVEENMLDAYQNIANKWNESGGFVIKKDSEVTDDDLLNRAVWIMDMNNALVGNLVPADDSQFSVTQEGIILKDETYNSKNYSWAITLQHPKSPDFSMTLLHINDMELMNAISRKLPHYGKYGYLVFEDAQNIAKGEWRISKSPLIRKIEFSK